MHNNDILRSLRFLLKINNAKIAELCKLSGHSIAVEEIECFSKDETDSRYLQCSNKTMAHFLDGMIIWKRGKDESRPPIPLDTSISNNSVLKKLRVAFQLKEEDLIAIMNESGLPFGKSEISAFLRKKDHRNYRDCGDQVLRNFLKSFAARLHRPVPTASSKKI